MSIEEDNDTGRQPEPPYEEALDRLDPDLPLAVLFVGGENDLGTRCFQLFLDKYRGQFRQVIFIAVGVADISIPASGTERWPPSEKMEVQSLEQKTRMSLDSYVAAAHELNMKAAMRVSISNDPVGELASLATTLARDYPKAVFFIGKLAFRNRRWFQPFLYGGTANKIQKRLQAKGYPVITLSVVV
jgi:hypothetical protein